ncbi:DUF4158 domain-containing protein [Mesorhizobium sp. NFR06]|uniref:DUF4158 domain-containing protein n=1 Tax=Mesorhizobium sp. NFR06 TaxID=1566290 RepID=UPI00165F276E|nr:DUF4158 domain-containing protein [Mesorhizobium sp. NFR06]
MDRRRPVSSKEAAILLGIATDEDSLIRHFTLDPADRLECELRRRPQNKLGFAVQLCTMPQTAALAGYRAATCGCDQLSCGSARYRRALHAFYAHRSVSITADL